MYGEEASDIDTGMLDEEFLSSNSRRYVYFKMTNDILVIKKSEKCLDYTSLDLAIDFNLKEHKRCTAVMKISKTNVNGANF